jgi:hypothetical protein
VLAEAGRRAAEASFGANGLAGPVARGLGRATAQERKRGGPLMFKGSNIFQIRMNFKSERKVTSTIRVLFAIQISKFYFTVFERYLILNENRVLQNLPP